MGDKSQRSGATKGSRCRSLRGAQSPPAAGWGLSMLSFCPFCQGERGWAGDAGHVGTDTRVIAHRGLKMKNNHLEGRARPSSSWADQELARSPATSCPARGQGCLAGVTRTKPPLCPRGERRRRRLLPGQQENKPLRSPEAGNSCFQTPRSAEECVQGQGPQQGSFPSAASRCLPAKLLLPARGGTPAPRQRHHPCARAPHGDGASRGYPEQCELLG